MIMIYDKFGQIIVDENDLINHLLETGELPKHCLTETDISISADIVDNIDIKYQRYHAHDISIAAWDKQNQLTWFMPDQYKTLDIAAWVLDQCSQEHELQRCGQELIRYQELDLFNMLRYLKYLVDTMRDNNIIWGVGRGSSVSSYVLYKIGIHRIDSIYYDLDWHDFLR